MDSSADQKVAPAERQARGWTSPSPSRKPSAGTAQRRNPGSKKATGLTVASVSTKRGRNYFFFAAFEGIASRARRSSSPTLAFFFFA
jgi:hypothetical protein